MNKLNVFLSKAENKAQKTFTSLMSRKEHGDETLIIKIILMVVAVFLCILFRDQLKDIINGLLDSVNSKIAGMYS